MSAADLDCVAEVARETGAYVLSDEIYSQLVFEETNDAGREAGAGAGAGAEAEAEAEVASVGADTKGTKGGAAPFDTIATREGMLERTIILDGCSKAFAMTGWRVGFGLFPAHLVEPARNVRHEE